jgi:hypothetical protein
VLLAVFDPASLMLRGLCSPPGSNPSAADCRTIGN